MAAERPWYVGERAEALAFLYLTQRKELEVIPTAYCLTTPGYDFLVYVGGRDRPRPTRFAVEVKGLLSQRAKRSASGDTIIPVLFTQRQLTESEIPVCLFVFTVDDGKGYYHWLFKPVISREGKASLRALDKDAIQRRRNSRGQITITSRFKELTDKALDHIVGEVTSWYEAAHSPS